MNSHARRSLLICALLAVGTLAALWPVVHGSFTFFDDDEYIVNNPHVRGGLTWANVVWAFRTGSQCNWHPLTWLSHMLDVELFGMQPGWHHLGNLVLHTANSLLLFLLLQRLTSAPWRSALVAAWFALHPLHVESVAWAAERKDVLSTLFFLLTLMAYARYVHGPESTVHSPESTVQSPESTVARGLPPEAGAPSSESEETRGSKSPVFNFQSALRPLGAGAYLLSLVCFALGLMSKPMLVTLPFVLILLDYWPLQRWSLPAAASSSPPRVRGSRHFSLLQTSSSAIRSLISFVLGLSTSRRELAGLLWEKAPFFALAALSSLVTYQVQQKGQAVINAALPLTSRMANAVASYWKYLGKTVWPVDLAVFYPHPALRFPSRQWPG